MTSVIESCKIDDFLKKIFEENIWTPQKKKTEHGESKPMKNWTI
jgi:hypothetical protein